MGFNKGGKFGRNRGGGRDFKGVRRGGGGKRDFGGNRGGRDGDRPMMHKATCGECGDVCQVPFRPTGEKPVFCSNCFQGKREGGFRDNREERSRGRDQRSRFEDRPKFQDRGERGSENHDLKAQLEQLNLKLDKVIKALNLDLSGDKKVVEIKEETKEKKAPRKEFDTEGVKKLVKKATAKKASKKASVKKVSKKSVKKSAKTKKVAKKSVKTKK